MQRLLPPKLLVLTALAMIVLRVALPGAIIISTPWNWLGLPVLCAGLAFIVFTEVPSMATILGGSVVLIVVLMSIRSVSSG